MSQALSGKGPSVVLRSRYEHLRALFVIVVGVAAALIAIVVVLAISRGDTNQAAAGATHASPAATPAPAATHQPCGVHYAGSSLTGVPCAAGSTSPAGH
jgi:hypothetical protein